MQLSFVLLFDFLHCYVNLLKSSGCSVYFAYFCTYKTNILSNMSDGFTFKRFTVSHGKCAMKVGTDGVLLGAWAAGGRRILDVGTGSGLIALMMAQRFADALVTAIDIEHGACLQARENVAASPFADRICVAETSLQDFSGGEFDSIVCNPPFYAGTLSSKTVARTMARSAETLPFTDLFGHVARLLAEGGVFSVVIPAAVRREFDGEAALSGLFPRRACMVKTVPHKSVSRCLLEYGKQPSPCFEEAKECLNNADMTRSAWYSRLTEEFYL